MRISSALARIRGVYASSPALLVPRFVASTGSSVGCTSSSEISKVTSTDMQGLIGIRQAKASLIQEGAQGIDDNDRASLDTPKEGTTVRDLKSRGGGNCGVNYSTLHLRDTEDPAKMWLPQKVQHCGEMVGITVDKNKGGWESLMAFAHN
ncbi:hypothetical protein MRB53_020213 [Persea americana]|uniref:Uncharacterized protein n=1 Tax=Persea americana TaxID=3435 RepID=A0ACC2L060_PERAE|nr:hypothetical protein MRB53_020213 [Persea americana]